MGLFAWPDVFGGAGQAELDFGAFPGAEETSLVITGQDRIVASSTPTAWILPAATADHSEDEHRLEPMALFAGAVVPGVGFTIWARSANQINTPLYAPAASRFRPAVTTVQGYIQPTIGGRATLLYGRWNVGWSWR